MQDLDFRDDFWFAIYDMIWSVDGFTPKVAK
jgi:hypothetical protein